MYIRHKCVKTRLICSHELFSFLAYHMPSNCKFFLLPLIVESLELLESTPLSLTLVQCLQTVVIIKLVFGKILQIEIIEHSMLLPLAPNQLPKANSLGSKLCYAKLLAIFPEVKIFLCLKSAKFLSRSVYFF